MKGCVMDVVGSLWTKLTTVYVSPVVVEELKRIIRESEITKSAR